MDYYHRITISLPRTTTNGMCVVSLLNSFFATKARYQHVFSFPPPRKRNKIPFPPPRKWKNSSFPRLEETKKMMEEIKQIFPANYVLTTGVVGFFGNKWQKLMLFPACCGDGGGLALTMVLMLPLSWWLTRWWWWLARWWWWFRWWLGVRWEKARMRVRVGVSEYK